MEARGVGLVHIFTRPRRTTSRTVSLPGAVRDRRGRHAVPEDDHPQSEGNAGLSEEEVIVSDQLNTEERDVDWPCGRASL